MLRDLNTKKGIACFFISLQILSFVCIGASCDFSIEVVDQITLFVSANNERIQQIAKNEELYFEKLGMKIFSQESREKLFHRKILQETLEIIPKSYFNTLVQILSFDSFYKSLTDINRVVVCLKSSLIEAFNGQNILIDNEIFASEVLQLIGKTLGEHPNDLEKLLNSDFKYLEHLITKAQTIFLEDGRESKNYFDVPLRFVGEKILQQPTPNQETSKKYVDDNLSNKFENLSPYESSIELVIASKNRAKEIVNFTKYYYIESPDLFLRFDNIFKEVPNIEKIRLEKCAKTEVLILFRYLEDRIEESNYIVSLKRLREFIDDYFHQRITHKDFEIYYYFILIENSEIFTEIEQFKTFVTIINTLQLSKNAWVLVSKVISAICRKENITLACIFDQNQEITVDSKKLTAVDFFQKLMQTQSDSSRQTCVCSANIPNP